MKKIIAIAFIVSLIISQFAIILKLKYENSKLSNGIDSTKWIPGDPQPDSTDAGPLKIRTDQIKDATITTYKPKTRNGVYQTTSTLCGKGHLATWVWANDCIVGYIVAYEDDEFYGKSGSGDYWFVRDITDSVKRAHRKMGNNMLKKFVE